MNDDVSHLHSEAVLVLEMALRDGARPIALLIGAGGGCSVIVDGKPLIPAIAQLTSLVRAEIEAVHPALAILEKTLSEDSEAESTVEDWLTRLRTLLTIVGDSEVRGLNRASIEVLESAIVQSIARLVTADLPEGESGYSAIAHWSNGFDRTRPLEVFTLSYDLLMEQALERFQISYFDGFLGSFQPFLDIRTMEEDALPARWTRLWKLHGSINWKLKKGLAYRTADWQSKAFEGALIHPSHLKYDQSRRMPYLAMQDRLRAFVRQPGAVLVTVGYSFGDQHINELIEEGLRVNTGSMCFGLLFDPLSKIPAALEIARRAPNLRIYAADSAVVGGREGAWKPVEDGSSHPNLGDFNTFGQVLNRLSEES